MPQDPEVWFIHIESQFATRGITESKTKYNHLVGALDPTILSKVRDVLLSASAAADPYKSLKEALKTRLGDSPQHQLQNLLQAASSDQRPSVILGDMERVLGSTALSQDFARQLFLSRLPEAFRIALQTLPPGTSLRDLATKADAMLDASFPAVASPIFDAAPSVTPDLTSLLQEIKGLLISQASGGRKTFGGPLGDDDRHRGTSPRRPAEPH